MQSIRECIHESADHLSFENCSDAAVGVHHKIYLTKEGEVFTSGCNNQGELGRDTLNRFDESAQKVDLPGKAVQISIGNHHAAVLLEDGRVFAWGAFKVSSFPVINFIKF